MGIDQSVVAKTSSGFHGDALNIAARIQSIAPVGGLAVSGRVYQSIDEPALRFRAVGRHRLNSNPTSAALAEVAHAHAPGAK